MATSWHAIHHHLVLSSSKLEFHRKFEDIQRLCKEIAPYRDPAALLDALHRGNGSPENKNRALAALVGVAQSERPSSDTALTLMLLALWPGLDGVRQRSMRRKTGTPDEITSEILARATDAIRRLDLQRVSQIPATILLNIQRDMIRGCVRTYSHGSKISETDPDALADYACTYPGLFLRDMERTLGVDAALLIHVAIEGRTQAEAAALLGLSEPAARKRYQRAINRLRLALEKTA